MTDEILNKISSALQEKIDKLQEDLEKKKGQHDNVSIMRKFLSSYNQSEFDINLIDKIYDDSELKEDLLLYCKAKETLNNLEKSGVDIFSYQIDKCKKFINSLVDKIQKKYNQSIKNDGLLSYHVRETRNQIEVLIKISEAVIKNSLDIIFDDQMSEIFFELLNGLNLSDEEKIEAAFWLTKNNLNLINRNIKSIVNNRKLEKKKVQNEQIKTQNEQTEISSPVKKEIVIETPTVVEEKINSDDINDQLNQKIQKIIAENNQKFNPNNISFDELVLETIDEQTSLKDRVCLYNTAGSIDQKKQIIIRDIEQLLPNIDNPSIYCLLEGIVQIYDDIERQQLQELDLFGKLRYCDLNDEIELCHKIDNILAFCENTFVKNYKGSREDLRYNKLYDLYCQICDTYENCKAAIELYLEEYNRANHSDDELEGVKELLSEPFDLIRNLVSNFEREYDLVYNPQESQEQTFIEKANDFYNSSAPIKNIYIFVDDIENEMSEFESQIVHNDSLRNADYKSILHELKNRVSISYNDQRGDHEVKSDFYNESFLNKYRVKSMNDDTSRIFYSHFSTTLGSSEMGYGDIQIVLLYSVGYGATDGNEKHRMNKNALKICYDRRAYVDQLISLFNTPWQQLSSKDRKEAEDKINYIIQKSKIKLGHLINTYEKNMGQAEGSYGVK